MTRLESLLKSIDPDTTYDDVSARIDNAINSFKLNTGIIETWQQFKKICTEFYCHGENNILGLNPYRISDSDLDWGRCCFKLINAYGPNGEKAAFEMARTGKEGGIYSVLRTIANKMIDEYSSNEIRSKIILFLDSLSVNEKFSVMDEYIQKYGHLLPDEIMECGAVRVKANFLKVLEEYPLMIKRLRDIRKNLL